MKTNIADELCASLPKTYKPFILSRDGKRVILALKTVIVGVALMVCSTNSFAASKLEAIQNIAPINIVGAALGKQNIDRFSGVMPKNYSSQLDYSTAPIIDYAGNPIPQGHAKTFVAFDLPHGEFKLYTDSLLPALNGPVQTGLLSSTTSIKYGDDLTVFAPNATANTPSFVSFRLEARGTFSSLDSLYLGGKGSFGTTINASNLTQIGPSASAQGGSFCIYGASSDCFGTASKTFAGGAFATATAGLKDGGHDELMLRIPLYNSVSTIRLDFTLNAEASQAVTDFSQTVNLFINAPNGVIFHSDSGLLVPEPESYAMFLAGLGLIGWRLRSAKG